MQDFDSPKLRVQFMVSWTVLESIWCHLDANFAYFGPTWRFFFRGTSRSYAGPGHRNENGPGIFGASTVPGPTV